MRTETVLGVAPELTVDGVRYTFKCGRYGSPARGRTCPYFVEVFQPTRRGERHIGSMRIEWNMFLGSPKTYTDYARDIVAHHLRMEARAASPPNSIR